MYDSRLRLARLSLANNTKRWGDEEICAAALECLPYLLQQSTKQVASTELVRPAQASGAPGADVLLRPAESRPDVFAAELPRIPDESDEIRLL